MFCLVEIRTSLPSFRYHLKDVIVGKIYFLLVRITIKHMEIAIIKKENTGSGTNVYAANETVAKYEIMVGAPVRGTRNQRARAIAFNATAALA